MKSKQHRNKHREHKRAAVLVICFAIFGIAGIGVAYKVELTPAEARTDPELANVRLNQLCQQKLLAHLKKGGIDLHAEMSYGDLQGCTFTSKSEQRNPITQDNEMSIITRAAILP